VPKDRSPLRLLVEERLGISVCDWVAHEKKGDPTIGVRPLAKKLSQEARQPVSAATLHRWCPEEFVEDDED